MSSLISLSEARKLLEDYTQHVRPGLSVRAHDMAVAPVEAAAPDLVRTVIELGELVDELRLCLGAYKDTYPDSRKGDANLLLDRAQATLDGNGL